MATREVSTWSELAAAVRAATAGDIIKLIADIDCNNEIPEGVASTIVTGNGGITIDGEHEEDEVVKRHKIQNLRTSVSSPVAIFRISPNNSYKTTTIKGIDFINLIADAPLIYDYNESAGGHKIDIRNCRFTGKRTQNLVQVLRGSSSSYTTTFNMYNSFVNILYAGSALGNLPLVSTYANGIGYMSNCRIRETFLNTYTPSSTDGDTTCSIFNMRLSGCRVEGEVVSGKYPRYHSDAVISGYTSAAQNVYDVDFKLTNDTDTSVPLYAFKGVVKVPIRKKDAETTTYEISSASTGVILADESQMQDTNWLAQNGFDIVPSNQG